MKRIAIGAVTALSVWFGGALAAEAQTIVPTGPQSLVAGQPACTYTATVYLPAPATFQVKLWVYRGTTLICNNTTLISNPGTNYYAFSKLMNSSGWNLAAGDSIRFVAQLTVGGNKYNANDWNVGVTGTRPSSKGSAIQKSNPLATRLVGQNRRKE